MAYQRHDVLVGRGPDIDDVVAAFEPLVARRMPEQPFGPFNDRNNLLARGRCVTADDMADMFFANEVGARRVIAGDYSTGIAQVRSECEIELFALIDFVDRHQRALAHLAGHHGVRSRSGKYEAERDGWLGHDDAR